MKKITQRESTNVCKLTMPKQMSDWIDERVNSEQHIKVQDCGRIGYAMKSRDCTVVVFPNWNCATQFKNITNKLR